MENVAEWQRLQGLYAGLGDEELLALARQKSGLTEVAQKAVEAEMAARGLIEDAEESASAVEAMPELHAAEDDPLLVELMTFQIAKDAQTALCELDEAGIPVRMEAAMRRMVEGGPRIKTNWLTIFVERTRQQDAVKVLRDRMGLFPMLAPEEMDAPEEGDPDGDSLFTVGDFDLEADAAVARQALTDAGIWFKESKIAEQDINVTVIETKLDDLERALTVVEAAFGE